MNDLFKPDSSNVEMCKYDTTNKILYLTFKGNRKYEYKDVDISVWEDLKNAESTGRFVNQRIKGVYDAELIS